MTHSWKPKTWALATLALLSLGTGSALAALFRAPAVAVISPSTGDIVTTLDLEGQVRTLRSLDVQTPLSDTPVQSVAVSPGSLVKKGQLLLQFEDMPLQTRLKNARNAIKEQQATLLGTQYQLRAQQDQLSLAAMPEPDVRALKDQVVRTRTLLEQAKLDHEAALSRFEIAQSDWVATQPLAKSASHDATEIASAKNFYDQAKKEWDKAQLLLKQAERAYQSAADSLQEQLDTRRKTLQANTDAGMVQAELKLAEAALSQAEVNLEQAILDLRSSRVLAPFDALITERKVEPGTRPQAQQVLLRLVSPDALFVQAWVDPLYRSDVHVGQTALLRPQNSAHGLIEATVSEIRAPQPGQNGQFDVRLKLRKPSSKMLPGTSVLVSLMNSQDRNQLLIPRSTLIDPEGEPAVWVLEKGKIRRQPIAVEPIDNQRMRVHNGLDAHSIIVTEPDQVTEGQSASAEKPNSKKRFRPARACTEMGSG